MTWDTLVQYQVVDLVKKKLGRLGCDAQVCHGWSQACRIQAHEHLN